MADNTAIEWTEATWNPIAGCSVLSPGCTNCYAMGMAARIEKMMAALGKPTPYAGLTQPSKAGPVWNGRMAVAPDETLTQPLRWKRPRRIFVNSMSDLFHEGVSRATQVKVWAVMSIARHHTFQILTKRAAMMAEFCQWLETPEGRAALNGAIWSLLGTPRGSKIEHGGNWRATLPLPNAWLGVSTEDQPRADERIPHLLATPAAVRFISAEPLLGAIDLLKWFDPTGACCGGEPEFRCDNCPADAEWRYSGQCTDESLNEPRLDWVIAGGESGPSARPSHPDWFRVLRDQCAAAGVPFFFKQWGEWLDEQQATACNLAPGPEMFDRFGEPRGPKWHPYEASDRNGGAMIRVGKKAAGYELDGKIHREFPT